MSENNLTQNKTIEIIPALLAEDFSEIEQKLNLLKAVFQLAPSVRKPLIQIDICDGQFVASRTWPFRRENETISQLEKFADDFDFELDLMVADPKKFLENERLIALSRSGIRRIIIHNKEVLPLKELFGSPASKIFQIGVAIPAGWSVEEIGLKLDEIDFIQFMGIAKIGYQGQFFEARVIEKIQNFRAENPKMIISIDGGVNLENAPALLRAGANRLVVGSALFQEKTASGVAKTLREFQKIRVNN